MPHWDKTDNPAGNDFCDPSRFNWRADGETPAATLGSEEKSTLVMNGMKISTIQSVYHTLVEPQCEVVRDLFTTATEMIGSYISTSELLTAFIQTITAGRGKGRYGSIERFDAADLKQFLSSESHPMVPDFLKFRVRKDVAFFITDNNCMGIGCKYAQPGDQICVLFGVRMPVILRPVGDHYRFLGLCYVHELMKGEAMEGLKAGRLSEEWLTMR